MFIESRIYPNYLKEEVKEIFHIPRVAGKEHFSYTSSGKTSASSVALCNDEK